VPRELLVFDMDGVLVDVSDSYRETIQQTVEHFTGYRPSRGEIQDWKNRGGWNDDWMLSRAMIADRGRDLSLDEVTAYFQGIFHGTSGDDGLILREKWFAHEGLFERLNGRMDFALFTGRPRWEAELTLNRFARDFRFDPIVGAGDVLRHKPAPDGLLMIAGKCPGTRLWYVGDTVDDARSARAASVDFIGIASPLNPRHDEVVRLLREENAVAVLDDINQLETVL
jgi:HAD superfamily phosphatase